VGLDVRQSVVHRNSSGISKGERHDSESKQVSIVFDNGNKVSFYVTNFPECLLVFRLRQQFEVCSILNDVFLARQQNSSGQVYGFVRFANVRNVDKLSQALNNVWFGHLKVWAREARFVCFAHNDKKPLVVSRSVGRHREGAKSREEVSGSGEGEKSMRLG